MTAPQMTGPKIKVALVGTGGWGRQHARVFSQRPDVDFCAVMGRSRERAEAGTAEFGVRPYTDIAEMLDKEKPDFVSLSLPNEGHFTPTLQVIQAGVPLLAEKPLVFDLGEADTLLEEAAKRDLFFAINFNHRYAKPVRLAHEAIQSGRLGELIFATWRFGGEDLGGGGHPHRNLIETQCHGFDMLEYLCGPIESVMAEMTDKTGNGFLTMALSLRFQNGGVGSLVVSYDSSYAYPDTHRVEVNGVADRVVIENTVRRYNFQASGSQTGEVWQAGYFNDREFHRTFDTYLEAMLGAFRRGEAPPVPAIAGRRALLLAQAAIRSFETGHRVRLTSKDFA